MLSLELSPGVRRVKFSKNANSTIIVNLNGKHISATFKKIHE
jgi:hypothetical protein